MMDTFQYAVVLSRADLIRTVLDKNLVQVEDGEAISLIRDEQGWESFEDEAVVALQAEDLALLAHDLVYALNKWASDREEHWETYRARIAQHVDCLSVVDEMAQERDDLLAGLDLARNRCFYDASTGRYGELQVEPDDIRSHLEPEGTRTREEPPCSECDSQPPYYFHEDECPAVEREEERRVEFIKEMAHHARCREVVETRIVEIKRAWDRIEKVADFCDTERQWTDYGTYLDVHQLLNVIVPLQHLPRCGLPEGRVGSCDCHYHQDWEYDHCRPEENDYHSAQCKACRHTSM